MLFWLIDKMKETKQREEYALRYEQEKRNAEEALVRINDLSKAEVELLSNNSVINDIYNTIFNSSVCPVEKICVRYDGIDVLYVDGTSTEIEYIRMGMKKLPEYSTTIFDADHLVSSVSWNKWGNIAFRYQYDETIKISDTNFFVYFCNFNCRNNDADNPIFPHFDYCLAIGHILAEKTGLQYRRPYRIKLSTYSSTMSTEFSFDQLKSW